MEESINISKRNDSVMFTIRIDKEIAEFYDNLSAKSNRDKFNIIE